MSSERWKEFKLGDLYNVFSGLSKSRDQFGFGHPFVTFKDVFYNYFLPDKLGNLANTSEKEIKSCSVKRGDIFLTRTSETQHELGMSSVALKDYENATFNGFTKRLRLKNDVSEKIDLKYIGYFLRGPYFRSQILQHSSLTTRASLNSTAIKSIKVLLPKIKIQEKIGSVLKILDDKIELNRQTNQTIEAIVKALFKEWFVDYQFPNTAGEMMNSELGKIPKRWRVGKLGEVVTVKGGTTPSTKVPDYWDGQYHWATPKDLSGLQFPVLLKTERKLSEKGVKQIGSGILPIGTLLLSSRAPIGYLAISQIPVSINQGFIAIDGVELPNIFLLYWLRQNMDKIIGRANGSTFLEISKSAFKEVQIAIPSKELLSSFDKVAGSLFEQIKNNEEQIRTLSLLRDSLLPKLMKGEIKIKL